MRAAVVERYGGPDVVRVAEVLTQAHVLGFGILVVLVILVLPNGIVGDWSKIRKRVFRLDAGI